MQENAEGTTKLGRKRRVTNADAMEKNLLDNMSNIRPTSSNSRRTIMPEFAKKKIATSKQSVDIQKKVDIESKEIELGLLYDDYLQTVMMDLIIKKKTEERKNLMVMQLATLTQEIDQDMKKLIKIKKREHDLINLSIAQKEIDAQIIEITKYTKNKSLNTVKDVLFKLHSLLKPLDVLRCNGVILPATQNEWKETQDILIKCSNTLKEITDLIGSKGELYCSVNDSLKNFMKTYNELEDLQKKLQEALCNLQILILKNTTLPLAHDESE